MAPQPFFELRGTPLNVLQMVNTLCGAGYEVHLVTFAPGEAVDVPGLRHHRSWPVPGMPTVPIGFSARKVAHDLSLALRVWQLLLSRRFDVVHAVEESVFFTLPLARLLRTPVIYDLDSSLSEQLVYGGTIRHPALVRLARAMERAALRRARLAITVCQALTDSARALVPDVPIAQIEDCPQGASRPADPDAVARLRRELDPDGAPLAVYTGNFASYQGLDLLFDALPTLAREHPTARLLVVGGSAEEIAEARAGLARRGVADRVIFAGRQPPALMPEFLALADVLVSPRREGTNTPLKLYDYMAAGRPIVATDLPTHRQVLDEHSALLVPPEPGALGRALARVLADPAAYRALGERAAARVERDFSREAFARKLLAAYASVLGTRAASASSM